MPVPRGDLYWRLTKDSVAPGYPRKISSDWRGLPGNIDAAFTWESSKATYFIKVRSYLVCSVMCKSIHDGLVAFRI